MCDVCEEEGSQWQDPTAGLDPAQLAQAARMIEADLPGERVAEDMWNIYFGRRAGCVDWTSFERIETSRKAAATLIVATSGWFIGQHA